MKTIEQKRAEAKERQAEYDKLSVEEKLKRLPQGASERQRAKLLKQQRTVLIGRDAKIASDKAEDRKRKKVKVS